MRLVRSALPALSILLLVHAVRAAPGDHLWSSGYDATPKADIAADGSVLMSGMFYMDVDFGGGVLSPSGFNGDMFVARFDAAGNHAWSYAIVAASGQSVDLVRADPDGGLYVAGRAFSGIVDFGGGALNFPGSSCYIARFDATGGHVFSAVYGDAELLDAVADAQGIVISGATRSSVDFGGGTLSTAGGSDAVVARLSPSGVHVFSARFGDGLDQTVRGIGVDGAGGAVMAVQIAGSVDFGGGPLTPSGHGLALVELDVAGSHLRSALFNGDFSAGITYNVHLDANSGGSFVVAGELHGSADFGGGALGSAGATDVYVASFDTDGTHLFSQSYGSASYQVVNSVDLAEDGSILLSGNFVNSIDFGGGPLSAGASTPELFLARLDASGNELFSAQYASASGAYALWSTRAANDAVLLVASSAPNLDLGGGSLGNHYDFVGVLEGNAGATATVPASRLLLSGLSNAPNPFNPRTVVSFRLAGGSDVRLGVFDARGRQVANHPLGWLDAGAHRFAWNGLDARGEALASGVYTVVVRAGESTSSRRITLVR